MPRCDDPPGRLAGQLVALEPDGPGLRRAEPGQRVRQLALPVPRDAGQPQDLAGPEFEGEAVHGQVAPVAADAQALHHEHRSTRLAAPLVAGLLHLAPGHERGQVGGGLLPGVAAEDHRPAPEDGDAMREGLHLGQLVADEDDGEVGRHALQPLQEIVGLLGRERGGGLVQHQQPGAQAERLHQLDPLLLAHRELPDRGVGIGRELVALRHLGHAAPGAGQVEPPAAPERAQPECDVLGHGHARHQHEVLVDHADAPGARLGRGAEADRRAVHQDAPLVRLVQAGQDVHERGLARTVLADQRVDLAAPHRQRDPVAGQHAREALGDALQRELVDGLGLGRGLVHGYADPRTSRSSSRGAACRRPGSPSTGPPWRGSPWSAPGRPCRCTGRRSRRSGS